ncbi:MAG: hypothetical protein J6S85_02690 [Methanobrevibacter sp.]|nr:hypothetical protein [Methanobrevibacter sp.]MBO7712447.1 hypothetical protein [Methanobrevibacter sp.]
MTVNALNTQYNRFGIYGYALAVKIDFRAITEQNRAYRLIKPKKAAVYAAASSGKELFE